VPKALQVASVFVLMLALVPGLPTLPFLAIGSALLLVGRARARTKTADEHRAATEPTAMEQARPGTHEPTFVPVVVPWSVEVSADLEPMLDTESQGLRAMAVKMRQQLFAELGVPLPAPRVRVRAGLGERQVALSLHEVPAIVFVVPLEIQGDQLIEWVRNRTLGVLRARASDFLGLAEVQRLLDELEQYAPATVRNVVPKPVTLVLLTDVLRRLVEEQISVRDLRGILEALSSVAMTEKDPLNLAEYVRSQMRRAITFRLTRGIGQLDVVLLDSLLEDTVRHAITRTTAGAFLTLPPQAARDVLVAVHRALAAAPDAHSAVILTQPDIRRFVRKLIESELPDVRVVSFAELLPEVSLKPISRATATFASASS
ncbi:MAG: flagellar biosynthesis protein FlhA, partial [Myxococcota bacterium]|nr:flagellar biosynthesis protein FlhA [Myxococcota bacterium]